MTAQLQICFLSEGTCAGEWNGSGVALRNSHPSACWDQQTGAVIGAKLALGELGPCHSRYLIPKLPALGVFFVNTVLLLCSVADHLTGPTAQPPSNLFAAN